MTQAASLQHFLKHYQTATSVGISLDTSRASSESGKDAALTNDMLERAKSEMTALEAGEIANADEQRMVGHYWLRTPAMAPTETMKADIEKARSQVIAFANEVHEGRFYVSGGTVESILLIGIGGSALGPLLLDMLYQDKARLPLYVMDNTDPDGIQRTLKAIPALSRTLVVVVSKSGGTRETRNGMLATEYYFEQKSVPFSEHAIAVTGEGSALYQHAKEQAWRKTFPIWDWVGGRTSIWSAVGLLPAALQGIDVQEFLDGAAALDEASRSATIEGDLALQLAAAWYRLGEGRGERAMVVLPYKDRLELLGKYLQQLVMESLGKRLDRDGREVHQGLTVYGNKGSTDQHSYIQQLRDGLNNFFAVFVEVLHDAESWNAQLVAERVLEDEATAGDFLQGFLLGTREALTESNRPSITLTLTDCSERSIGALLALFERAVGYYASMINVNAYHQPGVEAGKKAASHIVSMLTALRSVLQETAQASAITDLLPQLDDAYQSPELLFKLLERMHANDEVSRSGDGDNPAAWTYEWKGR